MGSSQSNPQKYELPRDIRPIIDIDDDAKHKEELKRYQGIMLKGADLKDHEDYKRIIEDAQFRKIILSDFDENSSDEQRQEILSTFTENAAPKWTFTDIAKHPVRYRRRLDRILELQNYKTLSKDVNMVRKIMKVNGIRQLILQNCNLNASYLKELFDGAINVTILDLSKNAMGIEEAEVIANFVSKRFPSQLRVRDCGFTEHALFMLVQAYNQNNKIDILDISGNKLSEQAIDALENLIKSKKLAMLFVEKCKPYINVLRYMRKIWKPKPLLSKKGLFKTRSTTVHVSKDVHSMLCSEQNLGNEFPKKARDRCDPAEPSQSQDYPAAYRLYDISVYRGVDDIWVVIDKEKRAQTVGSELPKDIILPRVQISLCEKKVYSVRITCEEEPNIVRTGPKSFDERQLAKHDVSIHRFALGETKPQTLEMKVAILHGKSQVHEEIIHVTWPFKKKGETSSLPSGKDCAGNTFNIKAKNCKVKGGAQASMVTGCEEVKIAVAGGVQNRASEQAQDTDSDSIILDDE